MEMRMQTRRNFLLGSAALVGAVATGVSLTTEPARQAVKLYTVDWYYVGTLTGSNPIKWSKIENPDSWG